MDVFIIAVGIVALLYWDFYRRVVFEEQYRHSRKSAVLFLLGLPQRSRNHSMPTVYHHNGFYLMGGGGGGGGYSTCTVSAGFRSGLIIR